MNLPANTPRNIVIFCDGTGNDNKTQTNVYKLYQAALNRTESSWRQVTWYDPGVGTGTSWWARLYRGLANTAGFMGPYVPKPLANRLNGLYKLRVIAELTFGIGITENIQQGYAQIVHNYRPGDRIYIFGFSRGAYTARCIAGVIARVGLLKAENIYHIDKVIEYYKECKPKHATPPPRPKDLRAEYFHSEDTVKVDFLGVWDTVASLGVPLWGWWFRLKGMSNAHFANSPAKVCQTVRHAISMDERRSQFFVTMFEESEYHGDLQQRWFRGSHAGIGGGYKDSGLSDIALRWMMIEAGKAGLALGPLSNIRPNPLSEIETELQKVKAWYVMGTWPRWYPCLPKGAPSQGFGVLDESVYTRQNHADTMNDGPLDPEQMLFLPPGETCHIVARGDRQWNRTGLVMEEGGIYRITYKQGLWQDKNCLPCGPSGQDAKGIGDWIRHLTGCFRRYQDKQSKWMELIGTITHPRKWDVREPRVYKLFRYLLIKDPEELTQSLFPLGRHMDEENKGVVIENQALGGMLHLFANDAWLFYGNNSGAIELEVERLPLDAPLCGRYVVTSSGKVVWQE